jgi:hypothetical protein
LSENPYIGNCHYDLHSQVTVATDLSNEVVETKFKTTTTTKKTLSQIKRSVQLKVSW